MAALAAYFTLEGDNTKLVDVDYGQTSGSADFIGSSAQGLNDQFESYTSSSPQLLANEQQFDPQGFVFASSTSTEIQAGSTSLVPVVIHDLPDTTSSAPESGGPVQSIISSDPLTYDPSPHVATVHTAADVVQTGLVVGSSLAPLMQADLRPIHLGLPAFIATQIAGPPKASAASDFVPASATSPSPSPGGATLDGALGAPGTTLNSAIDSHGARFSRLWMRAD